MTQAEHLFTTIVRKKVEDVYLIDLVFVKKEQQKEPRIRNSKLRAYMQDWISSYSQQELYYVEII